MKNKYSEKIAKLLLQTQPNLTGMYRLEFKNVFGAVGSYINGRIFISCGKFGIALRLPLEVIEVLFREKSAKYLKYFPKGHIKKEYAVLSNKILKDKHQLKRLVNESIKYANQNRITK